MLKNTAMTMALLLASAGSFAECNMPDAPTLPDGGSANMEAMIAGQKAIKAFQAANLDYMACLEKLFTEAESKAESTEGDEHDAAKAIYDKAVADYNDAVSLEEELAGQFNTEIREYKAANPG